MDLPYNPVSMPNHASTLTNTTLRDFVDSRNVALSHLCFEAALAQQPMPACAGRPFVVTDPGPPVAFADLYKLIIELSTRPITVATIPPILLLIFAHLNEIYVDIVTRFPFLARLGLREPTYPINYLQPSVLRGSMHVLIDDTAARKSVKEGGIGYRGVCNSLEGFCEELLEWNREHDEEMESAKKASAPEKLAKLGETTKAAGA